MALYMVEKLVSGMILLDLRGRVVLGEETEALRERVVLNLEEVTYMDSSGLSTLVSSFASVRKQGGELKLLNLTKRVRDLLLITKLSTVFETYDKLEDVQRSFAEAPKP
jgi:anti-sigma B factor antagonist